MESDLEKLAQDVRWAKIGDRVFLQSDRLRTGGAVKTDKETI